MESLRTCRYRFLGAMALALAICLAASAADEEVVVLRSGGVLHGKISVRGERYVVTRANSVVDVSAPQVLLVAHSMEDAYQQQRQQLPHDTSEAHLALAEWCLRYDLLKPAERELADARRLDPRDPRIFLLARRLAVAKEPKTPQPAQAASTPHDDSKSKDELHELELLVKELPPGVVERFTRKVQPLLVNSCTTSGCHQRASQQDFHLDRAVLHGLSNRRITLRNLVATLALVDRDAPQQSDLLSIPRRTHGGLDRPIFGPRQESQLTQLVDWVGLVTETSVASEPMAVLPDEEAVAIQPLGPHGQRERTPRFDEPQQSLRPKGEVKFGAEIKRWQPKDEFDPEIFNRNKPAPATTTQSTTTAVGPEATR